MVLIEQRDGIAGVEVKVVVVGLVPEAEVVEPDGKRRREDEPIAAAEVPFVGAGEVVEDG